ncbi:MAG TPA: hypothetical protein VH088_07290 [Terriglobales bacterium]|nr:hypothetical protein [Terriglobales bacterium]
MNVRVQSLLILLTTATLLCPQAKAGGPLLIGGPGYGIDGQPFTWDASGMPIQYRVDGGPMSKTPAGATVISNSSGLKRVQGMFNNWQQAPNTALSFQYAGPLQPSGTFVGGDVITVADFNAVIGSCNSGQQNPIIFDADGTLLQDLGLPGDVIGFASICKVDEHAGHILSAFALMNGQFQDGVNVAPNYELTAAQFDQAITHEIGHFSGLDHSQINLDVLNGSCTDDNNAGLPLMFPIAICPARTESGLPILAPDDQAWIARLYPSSTYSQAYGTISGVIYFSDGMTQAQGVNVIARRVDDPSTPQDESRRVAFSVVSGFRFTGNPGQNVTGTNTGGARTGSRDATLIGYYEIAVPPGNYTVEVESISSYFVGGSSVGPLDPPIYLPGAPEFWNSTESAYDDPTANDTISVSAGQAIKNISIILNGTPSRFDDWEDGGAFLAPLDLFAEEPGHGGNS